MINETFMEQAQSLKPKIHVETHEVQGKGIPLKTGDDQIFDFGDHFVGTVEFELESYGRHPDAPALLEIQFAEVLMELNQNTSDYHGWIAKSWIQKEQVHVDILPSALSLERRYAFRYIKVKVISVSNNFSLLIKKITAKTVSSADPKSLVSCPLKDRDRKLDAVSIRTLHNCMQDVFEDGPKRDRRLWLGDLRLEALTNYVTYQNYDLVKRCLLLFAGSTLEDGRVSNNIFLYPQPVCDQQTMFDYTIFFISTLWEYYLATNDITLLKQLEPVCTRQIELLGKCFDEGHRIDMKKAGNVFVDWNFKLDKEIAAQGIYIYGLRDYVKILKVLYLPSAAYEKEIIEKTEAALSYYDEQKKLFVSSSNQVSAMSQIWMILSRVVVDSQAKAVLDALEQEADAVGMVSPYAYHHYIQALIDAGYKKKAYEKMHEYWGGMIEKGADTFWELYDPNDSEVSPYGGLAVHSYCHAWSCTPAYFLRTYFRDEVSVWNV